MKYFFTYFLAFILLGCGEPVDPRVGIDVSNLSFKDEQLQNVSLSKFKGKPTVINLWATWCSPCIKELPSLIKLQEKYQVILINTDAKHSAGIELLAKKGFKANISLWDKQGRLMRDKLSAMQLPQTFIIDANMVVKGVEKGDKEWVSPQMLKRIEGYITN